MTNAEVKVSDTQPKDADNKDSSPEVEIIQQELERLDQTASNITATMTLMMGPLPPPEVLASYKEVDPELVNWIKEHTEAEQAHRHAHSKAFEDFQFHSLYTSLTISALSLASGLILAVVSNPVHGLILAISGAVVSILGAASKLVNSLRKPKPSEE